MESYLTFLDEHGVASFNKHNYFVVTAVSITPKTNEILTNRLEKVKLKYFGKKSYIIHRNEVRSDLIHQKEDLDRFSKDIKKAIDLNFSVFQVIIKKDEAKKKSWVSKTIYHRSFRNILNNIVMFSVARDVNNTILSEASSDQQDFVIYKSFFHFLANGIENVKISELDVKKHLTSLNFVTKLNNDAGEQLSDLLGPSGRHKYQIENKEIEEDSLDCLDLVLYNILEKKLYKPYKGCKDEKKKIIYPKIESFKKLPENG